jgi:hypothetical protein
MRSFFFAALSLAFALPAAALETDVPLVFSHHGRLLDPTDAPLAGPVELTVSFYELSREDDQHNDPLVWSETYHAVPLYAGMYSLLIGDLGEGQALAADKFPPGKPRWLELKVNGQALSPRMRVGSVPFALLAARALSADHADAAANLVCAGTCVSGAEIDGQAITADKIADGTITAAKIANGSITPAKIAAGTGSGLDADTLDGKDSAAFALATDLGDAATDLAALEASLAALANPGALNASTNPVDWTRLKGVPADLADGDQGATAEAGGGLQETGGAFSIATDAASLAKVSGGAMAAAGGSVGIGTATPGQKLEVAGAARVDGRAGAGLYLDLAGTGDFTIRETATIDVVGLGTAVNINVSSGNVGIGTAAPADRLGVSVASGTNPGVTVTTSGAGVTGGATLTLDSTSKGGRVWKLISESADNQGGAGSFALYDHTGGQNRITVTAAGDVGIGTPTPGAKLEVAGPIKVQKLALGAETNSASIPFRWWTMTCVPRSIYYASWPGAWGICICHEGGGSLMCLGS